jgi:hypothetical protein
MTTSRTASEARKCFSICGVVGNHCSRQAENDDAVTNGASAYCLRLHRQRAAPVWRWELLGRVSGVQRHDVLPGVADLVRRGQPPPVGLGAFPPAPMGWNASAPVSSVRTR